MCVQLKEDIHDANQRHESENMRFEDQARASHEPSAQGGGWWWCEGCPPVC